MSVHSGGKVAWPTPPTALPAAGWREDFINVAHLNSLYASAGAAFNWAIAGVFSYSTKFAPGTVSIGWHWITPKDFDPTGQLQYIICGYNSANAGGNFNYNYRLYARYLTHQTDANVAFVNFSDCPFTTTNQFKTIVTPYTDITPDGVAAAERFICGRIDRTDANANDIFISAIRIRYKYLTGF